MGVTVSINMSPAGVIFWGPQALVMNGTMMEWKRPQRSDLKMESTVTQRPRTLKASWFNS